METGKKEVKGVTNADIFSITMLCQHPWSEGFLPCSASIVDHSPVQQQSGSGSPPPGRTEHLAAALRLFPRTLAAWVFAWTTAINQSQGCANANTQRARNVHLLFSLLYGSCFLDGWKTHAHVCAHAPPPPDSALNT